MDNATNPSNTRLDALYDKVETQMRSLESLSITKDKYAAVLLPIVESALPEEILKTWQRSCNLTAAQSTTDESPHSKDRLKRLTKFLENKVHGETRLSMVRSGFSSTTNSSQNPEKQKPTRKSENKDITSAVDLAAINKVIKCIFCDKVDHASVKCEVAAKLSLDERKGIVKRKKGCFDCLNIGHIWKKCHIKLQCARCSRRHATLMCPFEKQSENV